MLKLKVKAPEPEEQEAPKININIAAPKIKVKTKQNIEGYDSEAPDKEEDPTTEEAMVLRMLPGAGLEKLQKMCDNNTFENLNIKFEDARRAILTVDGVMYAAQLVDLPTVTEVQKTFDRKNIYKSVDICQMLLVVRQISSEGELASAVPLKQAQQYQHGIAPPLHNVRNRRFHHRVSNKLIEVIETKVDELFKKDQAAQDVSYELLPASSIEETPGVTINDIMDTQIIAEDDEDEEEEEEEEDGFDMIGELEKALEDDKEDDEDDDDSDDDDDDDADADEDHNDSRKLLREEIHELQVTIAAKERESEATVNQIMKGRLIDNVNRMRSELEMKTNMLKDIEEREQSVENLDEEDQEEQEQDEEKDDDDKQAEAHSEPTEPKSQPEQPEEPQEAPMDTEDVQQIEQDNDAMDDDLDALF